MNSERGIPGPGEIKIGLEKLPEEAIEKVVLNPIAKKILSPAIKYFASEEFLTKNVYLTCSVRKSDMVQYVSPEHGRSFPLMHGEFHYGDFFGTVLLAKGGWQSGRYFKDYPKNRSPGWGIETKWDADGDLLVNAALLENNFYANLTLGYCVINPKAMKEQLIKAWPKYEGVVKSNFYLLDESRQKPVLSTRIGGCLYRIIDISNPIRPSTFLERLAKGAEVLTLGINNKGAFINRAIKISGSAKSDILAALKKIAEKTKLTDSDFQAYTNFHFAILASNLQSLHKFWINHGKTFHIDGYQVGQSKDTDFSLMHYDFDTAFSYNRPRINDLRNQLDSYITNAIASYTRISDFLSGNNRLDSKARILSESIADQISECLERPQIYKMAGLMDMLPKT